MVKRVEVSTFDSGFGGFFTAQAISEKAIPVLQKNNAEIFVSHYGDTANAPYGEKTEEEIATLTAAGVNKALTGGADFVFIACNTASTQYEAVKRCVEEQHPGRSKDIISIIDESVRAVKDHLDKLLEISDEVYFGLLATPATLKSRNYPDALAALYEGDLVFGTLNEIKQESWNNEKKMVTSLMQDAVIHLKNNKKIYLSQVAPANWVSLIEGGASDNIKQDYVKRDLDLLQSLLPADKIFDVVGEFCTHYPVFDKEIRHNLKEGGSATEDTAFIVQAPLMAMIFERRIKDLLAGLERSELLQEGSEVFKTLSESAKPTITISGDNIREIKALATKSCNAPDTRIIKDDSQ